MVVNYSHAAIPQENKCLHPYEITIKLSPMKNTGWISSWLCVVQIPSQVTQHVLSLHMAAVKSLSLSLHIYLSLSHPHYPPQLGDIDRECVGDSQFKALFPKMWRQCFKLTTATHTQVLLLIVTIVQDNQSKSDLGYICILQLAQQNTAAISLYLSAIMLAAIITLT